MTNDSHVSRAPLIPREDGRQETVLIVDDDRIGAEHVRRMIEALGHAVLLARGWTDALQLFASRDIDLVFMDAVMPNVDGFKLTRIFRERARSYVPIVFLTGLSDERARRRSVEAGADDLLTKPIDELDLSLRIASMLRIRRLTRALEEKTRMLGDLARVDPLTGLLNRRELAALVPKELARARRYGRALSVLMLDVDHFKRINDTFGHPVGDAVLVALGGIALEAVRATDLVFRYGGEEVVIIAPETPPEQATVLAERVRRLFRERTATLSTGAQTLSIGIAGLGSIAPDADGAALQAAADRALYRAKRGGRDRVCVHSPDDDDESPSG